MKRVVSFLLICVLLLGCAACAGSTVPAAGPGRQELPLRGEEPLAQAVAEVKLRSRQYAKRQLTWFRRTPGLRWITWEKDPDLARGRQEVTAYMEEFGI